MLGYVLLLGVEASSVIGTVLIVLNNGVNLIIEIGDKMIIIDPGLTSLYYNALDLTNCTLYEVKKLNDATTYSYRLGKVYDS